MPTDALEVRPGAADDLAAMVAAETDPDTAVYLGETGPRFHDRALADADQEQLVARIDDEPVGFVVLAGLRSGAGRVELRRIVVSHRHRGAGHGRALLRAAVARAYQQHRAQQVWLDVRVGNNRARALYESEGFRIEVIVPDPVRPGDVLVVMTHAPKPTRPAGERSDG
ncbi:GNAT family N-acetyltransferase [Micromonospora sp. AKA38]|uniref:GNAT family N-acetyltransferase n=1 Tax=Micromonospora sp. AKA38 TaxID=2733861 RepID=UPI0022CB65BB|nr:GNAT family N-acetyltransferase [Micromonospora sp. AKA38]GHJ15495.1 hypothetical protein TPA0908_34900 [Micromonospora sp. AKA38]